MADVIVVGAGPAGSVLATLLAEHELSVLLFEKATFPRPKVCGDYLNPGTVRLLRRLGLLGAVEAAGPQRLRGMQVTSPDGTTFTARFPTGGAPGEGPPYALSLPRATLDLVLLEEARRRGVPCREGFRVTGLLWAAGRVCGVRGIGPDGAAEFRGRIVVGADGRNSVVARRLDVHRPHPRLRRMALEAYYQGPSRLHDHGVIALTGGYYGILNPVGQDLVNASIVLDHASLAPWKGRLEDLFDDRLAGLPHAAGALAGMRRQGGVGCLGPLAFRARRTVQDGAILIGDAAGFYDPFTGEGVSHALGDAERAARCIARALAHGHEAATLLAVFGRAQRRARAERQRLGAALQAILRRPALANALARCLCRHPPAADLLLGVIGELLPVQALWSGDLASSLTRYQSSVISYQ